MYESELSHRPHFQRFKSCVTSATPCVTGSNSDAVSEVTITLKWQHTSCMDVMQTVGLCSLVVWAHLHCDLECLECHPHLSKALQPFNALCTYRTASPFKVDVFAQ